MYFFTQRFVQNPKLRFATTLPVEKSFDFSMHSIFVSLYVFKRTFYSLMSSCILFFIASSIHNPLHATIVMMNLAFADSVEPDNTIKNIENYLDNEKDAILKHLPNIHNEFGSFDIINLYPIRMPKSEKLNEFLGLTKNETEKYQKFVKEYLSK